MKKRIGILLDYPTYRKIPTKKSSYEKIQYYHSAAKKHDLIPLFMTPSLINPKKMTCTGYEKQRKKYSQVVRSIPKVIHNRAMPGKKGKRILKKIEASTSIYNRYTRYTKLYIHRILNQYRSLQKHLPATETFNKSHLSQMMKKHKTLFIKPISNSVGNGIIKISRIKPEKWKMQTNKGVRYVAKDQVYQQIKLSQKKSSYLVQEGIALATYRGNPYDLRVSVQKNGKGEWQITGIIGKVAGRGKHVTNVAKGGKVVRCERLFAHSGFDEQKIRKEVEHLALEVAKTLDKKLTNLADLGLDIGVTPDGDMFFIEMNGRDQRYSFRNGRMLEAWSKTYENPIDYGHYLLCQQ
ncbi:YheC/YheD family endospore coat-associated protein [Caldalkalibacillus mannanilyticus]|uniref:YheC/YheD family endospore coat-associated protein n=1 Tax=Caldalkalibacillus mannanilyticus TaxID=1418 RepID=UPI00046A6958|nr:YheC/YheD family protein [Caldalkalibacillus mannanilyticus]